MIPLAIKIFLAHLIGDFVLQSEKWVLHKQEHTWRSKYLYLHIGVHAAALLILLQAQYLIGIGAIVFTHYVIDGLKLTYTKDSNEKLLFALDQLAHLAVLVGVVYYCYPFSFSIEAIYKTEILLLLSFIILVTKAFSICIRFMMSPWTEALHKQQVPLELKAESTSLKNAGSYIGMLERLFVFAFIILGQWAAIGFLITAKSVFRFGDLTEAKNRKLTEYVLIGTLLSFGLAIGAGLLFTFLANIID